MGRKKEQGGFTLYREALIMLSMLDDRSAGKVIHCAAQYFLDGTEPPPLDSKVARVWEQVKDDIDASHAKYEKICARNAAIAERRAASSEPDATTGNDSSPVVTTTTPDETNPQPNQNQNQNQNQNNNTGGGVGNSACARECDPEIEKAVDYYAQHIDSSFGRRVGEELVEYTSKYGSAMMIYAIDSAMAAGKRTWAYIRGILRRWDQQGVKTLADVQRLDAEHDAEMQHKASPGGSSQHTAAQSNRKPSVRDATRSDAEREAAGNWLAKSITAATRHGKLLQNRGEDENGGKP